MKDINSSMKPKKTVKQHNTSRSQIGMGDFYGTGMKQKVGRTKDIMTEKNLTKKQMKSPPKSLA